MLHNRVTLAVMATAAFATGVASTCNPLKKTTCSDDTALASAYSVDFTDGEDSDNWSSIGSGDPSYTSSGAEFVITEQGDAPTIQSEWYIFFGRVEVHMKAATGTGIVSCAVLLSDDLDEIDWEFLGGDADEVQTNYFSKGDDSTSDREVDATVDDTESTSHNYTLDWTKEACIWYIDGTAVRTLSYDADTYPQTPMRVKLGIWAGGDSDNAEGTITWAGGETDYDDGPFTMTVESVKVTNYNPGGSYTYGDQTGDYDSIVINDADSSSSSTTAATSATSSSTLSTKTKTTSATTIAASTDAAATYASTATPSSSVSLDDNSSVADSTGSSDSSSTPASSTPAATTTGSTSFATALSPRSCIAAVLAAVVLGYLF